MRCHVFLHIETAQRRTALTRRLESRGDHIAHRLFGQRCRVDDHRIEPPGLGDQRSLGGKVRGHRTADDLRGLGRAGEHNAVDARVRGERRADRAALPRQKLQCAYRNPRLVQQLCPDRGNDRRLLGRLGENRIAHRQRRRDLPCENRQREVPWRNRSDAPKRLDLAARFSLCRIVAQEIDRLAQLAHRVGQGLACLTRKGRKDQAEILFVEVRRPAQHLGACRNRRIPRRGPRQRKGHTIGIRFLHRADLGAGCGIGDGNGHPARLARDQRTRGGQNRSRARGLDPGQRHLIREVEPGRIRPFRRKEIGGFRQACGRAGHGQRIKRVARDFLGRDLGIDDLVHEGRIRTILQQPPHEIGQQVPMRPDRRIDAATAPRFLEHHIMQPLAHAVKPLELERRIASHLEDRGHGMRIMRRKLRIEARGLQKLARIAQVADIGRGFGREEREVGMPLDLRALHLTIPIGPFHQAHHELAIQCLGGLLQPVDHRARAFAIGLHDDAEPVPTRKLWISQHRPDDAERQGQPVLFLRVDIEAHIRRAGLTGERSDHRHEFRHHPVFLRDLIARMQRRELHRNPRIVAHRAVGAGRGDGRHRIGIGAGIARRVARRHRRLTQHVVAVGVALGLLRARAGQRVANGLSQNELPPHFLHRARHGRTDHRLTQTLDRAAQRARQPRLRVFEHPARQHQGPGRGIDQRGRGLTQMPPPVRGRDLVLDQLVDGLAVRHAQHRFGQTHQRHAFTCRKTVFRKEMLHERRRGLGADAGDITRRALGDARADLGRRCECGHQIGEHIVLGAEFQTVEGGRLRGGNREVDHGRPLRAEIPHDSTASLVVFSNLCQYGRTEDYNYAMQAGQMTSDLDSYDRKILSLLTRDARMPVAQISQQIGLSKTPVAARIKRMEESGLIAGYRAILSTVQLGLSHIAFVEVKLTDTRESSLRAFNAAVKKVPEIAECHMIAGGYDYLLKVRTSSIEAYRIVMGQQISALPHVLTTSTYVAMETVVEQTNPPMSTI